MNANSHISVQRITGNIGAVVEGADLRAAMSAAQVEVIRKALVDNGVIFFRDQDVTAEQYWTFLENFGVPLKEEATGSEQDTSADVLTGDLSATRYATAVWHSDTTSLARPPIATALRAIEVPPFGGDTCWSSMYAAWDALSGPMQRMLDGLTAIHTAELNIARLREYGESYDAAYSARHAREQIHPVVLTHPESGRKALYVNEAFTIRIVELDRLESQAVLNFLFRHVERPDFTVRWKWTPNDIAFWDNRAVQHYAVPDYETARRMQRIVLAGVRPGESSALSGRRDYLAANAA